MIIPHWLSAGLFSFWLMLSCFVFPNMSIAVQENTLSSECSEKQQDPAFKGDVKTAEPKDALSQFMLGVKSFEGNDGQKAFEWFHKSADQGFATAQFFLGKMYADGKGVEKNDQKAFEWFQKAANQGHIEAQFFLGKMYAERKDIKNNEREAFKWFEKAADEGHGAAAFSLGKMYAEGQGVENNEKKALEWITIAAEQGYPIAKANKTSEVKKYPTTFNKLLQQVIQSKRDAPLEANVIKLSSFAEALPELENLPSDTLVIFDLDETVVVSRDESLPPALTLPPVLTEPFLANLINDLQRKGLKTVALTNSMTFLNEGDSSQEEFRTKELLQVGIDFSKSFQQFFIFNTLPIRNGHYPLLSKGIIYTNGVSKGQVLSAFLEKMKGRLKPSLIIFFDDRLNNILDVKKTAEENNIKYIGFYYKKILNLLNDGMSYQDIQIKLLQSEDSIPSRTVVLR
jgi:hypothetical protein